MIQELEQLYNATKDKLVVLNQIKILKFNNFFNKLIITSNKSNQMNNYIESVTEFNSNVVTINNNFNDINKNLNNFNQK